MSTKKSQNRVKEPSLKFQSLFRDAVAAFGADCCNDTRDHGYDAYKQIVYAYVAKIEAKAKK
jgi:hypothetical protein